MAAAKGKKAKGAAAATVAAPVATAKKREPAKAPAEALVKVAPADAVMGQLLAKHVGLVSTRKSGVEVKLRGVVSTRLAGLDRALGRGGFPMERITVISGGEGVGKTTLLLHACAEVQAMGGIALYVDLEHKLDLDWAAFNGCDLDTMIVSQPESGEQAMTIVQDFILATRATPNGCDVPIFIAFDSINAATPKAVIEGDFDDSHVGALARVFNQALPKITKTMKGMNVAMAMISQPRTRIGSGMSWTEKVSGGNAVKFYMAVGIELKKAQEWLKVGERRIGTIVEATVFKNQVARPYLEAELHMVWGEGYDRKHSLLELLVAHGKVMHGAGNWYEMRDPEPRWVKCTGPTPNGKKMLFETGPEGEEERMALELDVVLEQPVAGGEEKAMKAGEALAGERYVKPEFLKWQGSKGLEKLLTARPTLWSAIEAMAK
jgi:recombination protein RecA